MNKRPIAECDAGDIAVFNNRDGYGAQGTMERDVVMTIKAPRGRLVIFDRNRDDGRLWKRKARCVRAFVLQHRGVDR